mmetsp:Transcript_70836/g.224242  ORF Transcript_70836/g.224242 Transcript_70836/m.224242 type:complete len:291 (+) Transcript_70836:840-1712(+)
MEELPIHDERGGHPGGALGGANIGGTLGANGGVSHPPRRGGGPYHHGRPRREGGPRPWRDGIGRVWGRHRAVRPPRHRARGGGGRGRRPRRARPQVRKSRHLQEGAGLDRGPHPPNGPQRDGHPAHVGDGRWRPPRKPQSREVSEHGARQLCQPAHHRPQHDDDARKSRRRGGHKPPPLSSGAGEAGGLGSGGRWAHHAFPPGSARPPAAVIRPCSIGVHSSAGLAPPRRHHLRGVRWLGGRYNRRPGRYSRPGAQGRASHRGPGGDGRIACRAEPSAPLSGDAPHDHRG